MDSSPYLESKLSDVEHGAAAFKVLALVLALLGCVLAFAAVLTGLSLAEAGLAPSEVAVQTIFPALNAVACFMIAWFLGRAGLLFWTVAALIREMREVV